MSPRRKRGGLLRLILVLAAAALLALAYGLWKASERRAPIGDPAETAAPKPSGPVAGPFEPQGEPGDGQVADTAAEPRSETQYGMDTPAHEILARMRDAWACYEASGCRLGEDSDPRAEYFEADRRLAGGMQALTVQYRAGRIGPAELSAAVHEVLRYDSGRGRAAAIGALGLLPPAPEHLQALFGALDQHHDEKLFELALDEFERYAKAGYGAEVDAFLQSNLRTGAHFPARTIARELDRFLTPGNVSSYRRVAEELPEGSRRAELIRQALEAWEGRRSGGP